MSMVPLLLVAIILILLFSIFYLIIYSEYNEQDYENKLLVLSEYAKRTAAEHPMPSYIQYVSEVDAHTYVVRTISTDDLSLIAQTVHDDRVQKFKFLEQQFETTDFADVRVRANKNDPSTYELRGDDGWMTIDCPFGERFDEPTMRCVPVSPCHGKSSGMYGLTESMIDSLVLNHRVPRVGADENTDIHPTMYLRCFEGGSHVIEECPTNYLFSGNQCVLRNDCENRPDGYLLGVFPEDLNINEYLICENGHSKVQSCLFGEIFDRRLMQCVKANPCTIHGVGYTYITDDIKSTQFYKCITNTEAELVTCINRIFENDQYKCSGDVRCLQFANGTGRNVFSYSDEIWSYDTAAIICDNYNVISDVVCDVTNIVQDKIFYDKFKLTVRVPRELYNVNTQSCTPFNSSLVRIANIGYAIENLPNDLLLNFSTAFYGFTVEIDKILNTGSLNEPVVGYSRRLNFIGINVKGNGEEIDCNGDYLYDPFEGTRLNICKDNELQERITFTPDQYFVPTKVKVNSDIDYQQLCAKQLVSNFVEFDHFTTQIVANILRSDVCGEILTQIHDQYTTILDKYTTMGTKIYYKSVNSGKYIERYRTNIPNIQKVDVKENKPNDNYINPMFDPFVPYETMAPLFDPWSARDIIDCNPDDVLCRPPAPPPEPPTLTLTDKLLNYTCFYAVPTFKLSSCNVVDDHIIEAIKKLRQNIIIEDRECESAAGLANIINAYAYLGDGIGCRSLFDGTTIKVVKSAGKTYLNIDTQSNDGVQYNKWIFNNNGTIMACPDHLIKDDFTCHLEEDRIYHLIDLQE
ncbi:vp91 [Alphabaculovirus alterspexiguae]|uniref:Vp91 n=1 Tax=Spodoptera exigua multiple nucleopolyhedrovirus TaxID=10454 RepID=A0A3G2JU07_9ABAC|nr:vp91 [Spodoptera exigua multiple nucleopolyhedrovirus]AYN45030.1 vp91 [Spodoptera exigua multiple nucleopolyhedrovirus]